MNIYCTLACCVLLSGCSKLCKTDMAPANTFNTTDDAFLRQAARYITGETLLAGLMLGRSQNSAVRELADSIISTNKSALVGLQALAIGGTSLPGDTTAAYLQAAQYLNNLDIRETDLAYMRTEVANCSGIVSLYNNEIAKGEFRAVTGFAKKYIAAYTILVQQAEVH